MATAPGTDAPREVLARLDRAALERAVAGSRSWRQVGRAVGLPSSRYVRRLRALCDEWSISCAHLAARTPDDDALRAAVAAASSWHDAMTRLGYAQDSGSARATIRARAARLGLDVAHLSRRAAPVEGTDLPLVPDLRNLRSAGPLLVAAVCTLAGHRVSWPLEPAAYDLLVDTGPRRLRLQVKTSSRRVGGSWVCSISRSRYAGPHGSRRALYSEDEIDAFAVVDGDGEVYLVPVEAVAGLTTLTLRGYGAYRVQQLGRRWEEPSASRADRI